MAKIMIVEDERDIRELVTYTLQFAGHEVVQARNGLEAVELAPQIMPDIILTDVRMPKMSGYEACIELRKLEEFKDTPIIFLSARGQEEEIQQGLEAGGTEYILKPFAPDELTRRVAELLEKYS